MEMESSWELVIRKDNDKLVIRKDNEIVLGGRWWRSG